MLSSGGRCLHTFCLHRLGTFFCLSISVGSGPSLEPHLQIFRWHKLIARYITVSKSPSYQTRQNVAAPPRHVGLLVCTIFRTPRQIPDSGPLNLDEPEMFARRIRKCASSEPSAVRLRWWTNPGQACIHGEQTARVNV